MKIMNEYLNQYQIDMKKVNKFDLIYFCIMFLILIILTSSLFIHQAHNLYWDLNKLDSKSLILSINIILFILIFLSSYSRLRNFYLKKCHIELEDINGSDVLIYNNQYVLDHWDIGGLSLGSDNIDIKDVVIDKVYYIILGKNKYEINEKIYHNLFSLTPYSNLIGIDRTELSSYKKI